MKELLIAICIIIFIVIVTYPYFCLTDLSRIASSLSHVEDELRKINKNLSKEDQNDKR